MAMHIERVRLKYGIIVVAITTLYILLNVIVINHRPEMPTSTASQVSASAKLDYFRPTAPGSGSEAAPTWTGFTEQAPPTGKVWVSMALCWGEKASRLEKSGFPYGLAGELSTRLWTGFNVSVIMTIVVCGNSDLGMERFVEVIDGGREVDMKFPSLGGRKMEKRTLRDYIATLEDIGALVKIVKVPVCPANFNCILHTQLVRLLAYQYKEVSKM